MSIKNSQPANGSTFHRRCPIRKNARQSPRLFTRASTKSKTSAIASLSHRRAASSSQQTTARRGGGEVCPVRPSIHPRTPNLYSVRRTDPAQPVVDNPANETAEQRATVEGKTAGDMRQKCKEASALETHEMDALEQMAAIKVLILLHHSD